jgi:hypothetical protein
MLEVIASIDNDREIFRRENLRESVSKFRTTDSACESNDFHFTELQSPSPAAFL